MPNTPCWKHCLVLRRVDIRVCHLTTSGRLPICAPIAFAYVGCWKRIPSVLVTFTRSCGDVCLARTNRFALSVRSPLKEMKKSERGGGSFVTDIMHTLETNVEGQHTPPHMKTSVRFQAAGVAMICKMGTNHFSLLGAKTCEKPADHE